MRESFVFIIALLLFAVRCSDLERDNYNLYKDHMRARSNDPLETYAGTSENWGQYVPDAPTQEFDYYMLPEYQKRASNIIRKHMVNELVRLDKKLKKRTSKAALSLMLQSKQDPEHIDEEHSCYAGK